MNMQHARKAAVLGVALFCVLVQASAPTVTQAEDSAESLLRKARSIENPVQRIELLDLALKAHPKNAKLRSVLHFERGLAHKRMKDCFQAIRDFNSSMVRSPDAIPALLEKAHCLILVDQLEEASRVLEQALLAKPNVARCYVLKGMIYEKEGFLQKAHDEYTRALYFDQRSSEAMELRAMVLLREGKPREALEDLNTLVKQEPQRHDILRARARVFVKLKEYDRALEDYANLQRVAKEDRDLIKEKVEVFFKTDRPGDVLAALSHCLTDYPDDVDCPVLQARAHLLLKNRSQAEKILAGVIARKPDHAPAHLYCGVAAMNRRAWDDALADLNRAIALDPGLVEAYKQRARVFMTLGEPVRAADDLTRAIDLDPADGEIYSMRGLTFISRMLYDASIADFTRALECLPGNPRVLYNRAVAHAKKDEWEAALHDLDMIIAAKPDAARALSLRGIVHYNMGNLAGAESNLNKSTELGSQDPVVWNNRGFFRYKTGKYKAAMEDFNRALQLDGTYESALHNLGLVLRKHTETSGATVPGSSAADAAISLGKDAEEAQ